MKTIEIYCDGAALNNGCKNSIASYGIVMLLIESGNIIGAKQYSGLCEPVNSTNNYAEITAALVGLKKLQIKLFQLRFILIVNILFRQLTVIGALTQTKSFGKTFLMKFALLIVLNLLK